MGFLGPSVDEREEIFVVTTLRGKASIGGRALGKARIFLLQDRTCVLVHVGPGGELLRETYVIESAQMNPPTRILSVTIETGDSSVEEGPLIFDASGCGCGMGAVGNAGPSERPYRLTKVRAPEWYSVGIT